MLPTLSVRLQCVADLIPASDRVVDVGTDHALLPIHLVMTGRCRSALARDLRAGPIAVARRNIARFKAEGFVSSEVADGLEGLTFRIDDTLVIAGLGGLETAAILGRAIEATHAAGAIVLQPMKSLPELRYWLLTEGFRIDREALCSDAGRFYCVLRCHWEGSAPPASLLDPLFLLLGKDLIDRRPKEFDAYLGWVGRRLEKELRGLEGTLDPVDVRKAATHRELIARIRAMHYNE